MFLSIFVIPKWTQAYPQIISVQQNCALFDTTVQTVKCRKSGIYRLCLWTQLLVNCSHHAAASTSVTSHLASVQVDLTGLACSWIGSNSLWFPSGLKLFVQINL